MIPKMKSAFLYIAKVIHFNSYFLEKRGLSSYKRNGELQEDIGALKLKMRNFPMVC